MGEEASTSPSAEDEAIAREASEAWGLEPAVARRVVAVARRVGTHPADLVNLIGFESAWDPTVRSRSGNVGLLQFARRMHLSRLEEIPRRMQEALERKRAQDEARARWRAEEAEFAAPEAAERGAQPAPDDR